MTPSTAMRIWHVDVNTGPDGVDGLSGFVWWIAREQALIGHHVTVFMRSPVSQDARSYASTHGFVVTEARRRDKGLAPRAYLRLLRNQRPDVVHLHGGWKPNHALLGFLLRRCGVPYIYSPHGTLAIALMAFSPTLRRQYVRFIEGPLVTRASGVALLPGEREDCEQVLGQSLVTAIEMPVPIEPPPEGTPSWTLGPQRNRLVYLGRFEPFQKGLDRLVESAAHAPELEFHLYGTTSPEHAEAMHELRARATSNVTFHEPVYGTAKYDAMLNATLCVQFSRFEGFSLTMAEAMGLGIPMAISDSLRASGLFQERGLGLTLTDDPSAAAAALRSAVSDTELLARISDAGKAYASSHFGSARTAQSLVDLYRDVTNGAGESPKKV